MSILEDNLKALSSTHPGLGEGSRDDGHEADGEKPLVIIQTPSGEPTALYRGTYVHSRYDPRKEALSLIQGMEGIPTAGILLGFGLGYAAEEFLRLHPSIPLLVVEPDAVFFKAALAARDLRAALGSTSLRLLVGARPEQVAPLLEQLPLGNPLIMRLRSVTGKNTAYFHSVEEIVHSFLLRRDININTLGRFGRLWVRNLASNMPAFLLSPGAALFTDLFEGLPALLLAGGPSLDLIVPLLKELSRRFLVVSVDTPLRTCLAAGVKPDFVVMVDPQYWASRYLDWTDDYDGFIVAEPSTHPRTFHGGRRRFILASSLFPLGAHLETYVGEKGKLGAGGSVSTSAWDLCRLLGAGPIYVAGMDLGFPRHRTHCGGAFFEELWFAVSGRLCPPEGRSFGYLREIGVFPMPSNSGTPTITDRRMLLYKWWFEAQLASADAASFSLSEEAVAVKGMPLARIADVLALPVVRPDIEARMARAREISDAFGADRGEAGSALGGALDALVDSLGELESLARKGLSATRDLARALHQKDNHASALERLNAIDSRILELSSRNIVGFLIQGLIHRITGSSSKKAGQEEILSTSEEMYRGIEDSARFHRRVLSKARESVAQFYGTSGRNNV